MLMLKQKKTVPEERQIHLKWILKINVCGLVFL